MSVIGKYILGVAGCMSHMQTTITCIQTENHSNSYHTTVNVYNIVTSMDVWLEACLHLYLVTTAWTEKSYKNVFLCCVEKEVEAYDEFPTDGTLIE